MTGINQLTFLIKIVELNTQSIRSVWTANLDLRLNGNLAVSSLLATDPVVSLAELSPAIELVFSLKASESEAESEAYSSGKSLG